MAIIPYQDYIGQGAAVHLRTPQAPDWTAKYQLAAQERRAREAERAKQDKDPNVDAGAELRKTISGINPTWAKEDTEGIDRMYNKIWETMDASGGNYSDPKFQQEISKQVWDLKAAMDLSKNWETRANTRTKEIVDNGVDDYENVEIFNDLKSGKFSLPAADGSKIEYDINKVKTLEDFAKFNQAREMAMDMVQKKFDENTYMAKHLPLAKKGATVTDYVTLPNGDKEVRTVEKPEIFEAELQKVYNGKQGLKKVYEERFAADPKGFGSAEEMFQAAYNPYFGTKKTTQKFAPQGTGVKQGDGYTASQKLIFTPATTPSFAQQQVDVVKQAVSDYDAQYAKYAEAQKAAGKTPEAKKSFSIPDIKVPDNALAFELTDTQSNIDRPFKDDAGNDINGKPLWIKDSNGKTRIDILETTKLHPSLPPTLTIKTVPYSETNKAVLNNAYSDPKAGIYFIDEEKKWRDSLPKKSEQNKSGSAQDNPIPITKGMKFEKGKWYKGANGEVKQYQ